MKITRSELKGMIRECLREALNEGGAMSGGYAQSGAIDTAKRPGASTSHTNFKALDGKKTKKVLAKDIKPGMITNTGKVLTVNNAGNRMEIGYGNIGKRGSYASDNVSYDHEYEVLDEAFTEDSGSAYDWETLIAEADALLEELAVKSGNADYDDGDGYWSGEEGEEWTNRLMYYTNELNGYVNLERLCEEYSSKLPNVQFYCYEDTMADDPVSEIGYTATNEEYAATNEGLDEGIFDAFGNKYKGKNILVYRGNGKEEPIAICDNKAGNYNLIHFKKAHAEKYGNDESDYVTVSGYGDWVKKYKKALKSTPDVTTTLPFWVKQYVEDEKEKRGQAFRNAELQKEREAEYRRAEARRKAQSSSKSSDDDYVPITSGGNRTYIHRDTYGTSSSNTPYPGVNYSGGDYF